MKIPFPLILVVCLTSVSCNSTRPKNSDDQSSVDSINHYSLFDRVPPHIRRVAVLPITSEKANWNASTSTSQLDPLLLAEISKLNIFEIVTISSDQLSKWSNQKPLQIATKLPNSFLSNLQKELACDAVLFSHLQSYRPYRPMVTGWKLHLVDIRLQTTFWAAEETFDASNLITATAARSYSKNNAAKKRVHSDNDQILLSPREFNQFAIASLFKSLPKR